MLLQVGDLVEVDRFGAPRLLLVVSTTVEGVSLPLLVCARGILTLDHEHSVLFRLPGYLQACTASFPLPGDDDQILSYLAKQICRFEIDVTREQASHRFILQSAYSLLCDPDPSKPRRLPLTEIVSTIFPSVDPTPALTLAVHRYLIANPSHYVICPMFRHDRATFEIKPKSETDSHLDVSTRCRTNSPDFQAFVKKSQSLIEAYRLDKGLTQQPVVFSASDLAFLNLVSSYVIERRNIQDHSQASIVPLVLQRVGMYDIAHDRECAYQFLYEVGAWKPWQDLAIFDRSLNYTHIYSKPHEPVQNVFTDQHADIRKDWGNMPVYVIDDEGASELDDGVSFEALPDGKAIVLVHIANPTAFIPLGHPITDNARQRGTSLYLAGRSLPMLPDDIVHRQLSLHEDDGTKQPVLTISTTLDSNGFILDINIQHGAVENVKTINYDALDKTFGYMDDPLTYHTKNYYTFPKPASRSVSKLTSKDLSTLNLLQRYSHLIGQRRALNQAIAFNAPNCGITVRGLDEEFSPGLFKQSTRFKNLPGIASRREQFTASPSRVLISNFAVLANMAIAKYGLLHNIPLPYRGQSIVLGTANQAEWEQLVSQQLRTSDGLLAPEVPWRVGLRLQSFIGASATSLLPLNHDIMGIKAEDGGYVRGTSPLRRYLDMVVHYQLEAHLRGNKFPLNKSALAAFIHKNTQLEHITRAVERHSKLGWAAQMTARALQGDVPGWGPDRRFEVVISRNDPNAPMGSITGIVTELGIQGRFPVRAAVPLVGQSVLARITRSHLVGGYVALEKIE